MKGVYKKIGALLVAGLMLIGSMSGCQEQEAVSSQEESSLSSSQEDAAPEEEPAVLENDGQATTLVVAELFYSQERTQALEEIAAKYMADHPETEIQIRTVETREEMERLVESGEADLCEVSWQDQREFVENGWLLDIDKYVDIWDDVTGLTLAARQVIRSMGVDVAYMLPAVLQQDVLYYRSDWFEDYNQDKEGEDRVYCQTWNDLIAAADKLQDRGECLVFGGKEKLLQVFDSVLWSATSLTPAAHTSAAYLCDSSQHSTLFSLEAAATATEQFVDVMTSAVAEQALEWTEDQAVEAFVQGDAAVLLAGQDQYQRISSAMEEGSVAVAPYPRGLMSIGILSQQYTGFSLTKWVEHEGNAADFLFYLSNPDNNTHIAKVCSLPPLHKEAPTLDPSLEEEGLSANLLVDERSDLYAFGQEPMRYQAWEEFQTLGEQGLRDLLAGRVSVEELLDQFDAYWSQALEEEGRLWDVE